MTTENANPADMTDDELEALQRKADGETSDTNPPVDPNAPATTEDDTAAADAATAAATPSTAAAATTNADADAAAAQAAGADATDTQGGKPEGVASKDGSRILPFSALQAERRSARIANSRYESTKAELDEAKQLIADLKAGKVPESELTEAEVKQMEEDFPDQGKKMRALFDKAQAMIASAPAKSAATAADLDTGDSPVQDAIDQVPLLVEWQTGDAEKFDRAIEHDALLLKSPKWKDKPVLERFTQAAKLTAEEFDIPFPEPKASTKPTTTPSTAKAVADAARATPNTLSDFKGGAVPDHGTDNFAKMPAAQLLTKFADMTDDELDAHLAKHG